MITLTLDEQYADILQHFGDTQEVLQTAVHHYVLEKTQQKIEALQSDIDRYEQKYGLPYQEFEQKVASDEKFIQQVEAIDFLWERDSNIWLHTTEELKVWQTRLASLSNR